MELPGKVESKKGKGNEPKTLTCSRGKIPKRKMLRRRSKMSEWESIKVRSSKRTKGDVGNKV